MRETSALVAHKAAEERHWDEAEEDDEENRPADDSLRLRPDNEDGQEDKQCEDKSLPTGTCHKESKLTLPFCLFCLGPFRRVEPR